MTLRDKGLFAQFSSDYRYPLFAASEARFFYRGVKAEIEFKLGKDGTVKELLYHKNGRKRTARRN